ncbi:hypothetical protein B0H34DRAFT_682448 [Crassisporium funariophilum]|nr:hypothetical protein B0H34DRAFT_682448 [Crassisporium funariophilum]
MHTPGSRHASPSNSQAENSPFETAMSAGDIDDDKQSILSGASGVPRAEQTLDVLRLVAGNRVRHARCAPEFLEEIATRGAPKKLVSKKFKIISGSEARSYFKSYIVEHNEDARTSGIDNNNVISNEATPSPIVFAVTVWEAGVKCVDYYMTWRGKTKALQWKDFKDRIRSFDDQFRQLAKTLDEEFRRISSLKSSRSPPRKSEKSHKASTHKSRPPPNILLSTPEEEQKQGGLNLPEPPPSAADSVMSLPLLNMVRGVPFSHRVPLRVTNPDRLSLVSEIDVLVADLTNMSLPPLSTTLGIVQRAQEAPRVDIIANNTLTVPAAHQSSRHRTADDDIKKSSASIRSSDTRSSHSSRSSRSSSRSENKHSSRRTSPGDSGKTHESSRRQDRHSSKESEGAEFLIVLLGDKLDKDTNSWHGLDRQTSIRSLPADRHSPWISPLARPDSVSYRMSTARSHNDSDSSEESGGEGGWKNSPVIPMKPMMEAMGLIPNSAYFRPPPVVPGSIQYHMSSSNPGSPAPYQSPYSNPGSPAPYQSPYLYGSPHLDSSPYVPAWMQLPQVAPSGSPLSRPPSRAYSAASYSSPYMQTLNGPF